ncbi:MAG TPA: ABC transporter permease subunit [Methanocella sp.]|uniref:ABC transporter permease subunit n=1 Tax=Methanocella sp. TaxID=2052833 RepID=UPI002C7F0825|nr:ABC transporter permease subunit [Methanocella sp.]HTY92014.1 ABC transporter permease subunit [Methanocella sp.]
MADPLFEIMKKELTSYYSQMGTIFRNGIFLVLFGALTIYQLTQVVARYGPTAQIIAAGLDVLLALAAFFPVNMAGGISVMAFPVERDQKTLEHLLSLPLSDRQIFLGKFIAAAIAGIAGMALMYVVIFGFITLNYSITPSAILSDGSLDLMAFAICPMLVILLILVTVIVSSRVSARETYIVNIFSVFVLMGLNIAVSTLNIDTMMFNTALAILLVPAILVSYVIGTRTFNRESLIKNL